MAHDVLILNCNGTPIQTVTPAKATRLLQRGAAVRLTGAEAASMQDDAELADAVRELEAIQLISYGGTRSHRLRPTRRNISVRDRGRCQYCGCFVKLARLTLDHVVPRSHGGQSNWQNLVVACGTCNQKKDSRTPQEAAMPLQAMPRQPTFPEFLRKWQDVFLWSSHEESD